MLKTVLYAHRRTRRILIMAAGRDLLISNAALIVILTPFASIHISAARHWVFTAPNNNKKQMLHFSGNI